jgi:hypothetical protein
MLDSAHRDREFEEEEEHNEVRFTGDYGFVV